MIADRTGESSSRRKSEVDSKGKPEDVTPGESREVGRKAELDDEAPTQVGNWSEGEVRDAISDDESEVDWKAELEDSISDASWRSVQKESWKARHLAKARSRVRRQNWTMQYPARVGG